MNARLVPSGCRLGVSFLLLLAVVGGWPAACSRLATARDGEAAVVVYRKALEQVCPCQAAALPNEKRFLLLPLLTSVLNGAAEMPTRNSGEFDVFSASAHHTGLVTLCLSLSPA